MIHRIGVLVATAISVVVSTWFSKHVVWPYFEGLPTIVALGAVVVINWVAASVGGVMLVIALEIADIDDISGGLFFYLIEQDVVEMMLLNIVIVCGGGIFILAIALSAFVLSLPFWVFKGA